jgi:hypothetical protein
MEKVGFFRSFGRRTAMNQEDATIGAEPKNFGSVYFDPLGEPIMLSQTRPLHWAPIQPFGWRAAGFVVVLSLAAGGGNHLRADDAISDRLLSAAPKVVQYVQDHHYQTVGVVKFSVRKGTQPGSYNAGTLNSQMALRLEHALIMANNPSHPLTILQDVTATAFHSRGLTLHSPSGRRGLISHAYPVAWGKDQKQPDILLTGEVHLSKNMKTATVTIQGFDRKHPERLEEVARLTNIPTNRDLFASAGQTFIVSRKPGKGRQGDPDDAAADDAAKRDDGPTGVTGMVGGPGQSADGPLQVAILYDDQTVDLQPDAASPGELKIKRSKTGQDVREGQKVRFKITNTSTDKIGVVLAINGRNTLFQEDLTQQSPGECSKWVLAPNETYTIDGFYMSKDGKSVYPFRALSDAESEKNEMAPEVKGIYSFYVFGGNGAQGGDSGTKNVEMADKAPPGSRTAAEAKARYRRALHVAEVDGRLVRRPVSRSVGLPNQARRPSGRGLVVVGADATTGSQLNEQQAQFDKEPTMTLFVRYYRPAAGGGTPTDNSPTNNNPK